jgi:hypothetical protein
MFATRPGLAGELLRQAHGRGIRAPFIAGGEVYGTLDLRKSIRELGSGYVMAARSNHCPDDIGQPVSDFRRHQESFAQERLPRR